MRWRSLTLTFIALLAVHPVQAQNWMGRYLSERKQREREEQRRATSLREEMERRARIAREEEEAATQPTSAERAETEGSDAGSPPPTVLSGTEETPPPAEHATTGEPEPEIRRALRPERAEASPVAPGAPAAPIDATTPPPAGGRELEAVKVQPVNPESASPYTRRYRVERLAPVEKRNVRQHEAEERRIREATETPSTALSPLTPFYIEEPGAPREEGGAHTAPAPAEAPPEVRRAERAPVPPPSQEAPSEAPAPPPVAPPVRPHREPVIAVTETSEEESGTTGIHNPARSTQPPIAATPESRKSEPDDTNAPTPADEAPETARRDAPPTETAPEEAIGTYSSRELDPGTTEIRLSPGASAIPAEVVQIDRANQLYSQKEYSLAAPEYEHYLSLYPDGSERPAAFFRLAECYRRMGSFNAARKNYEALIYTISTGEFIGPASYRLAEICFQEEDYTAAAALFLKASVWVKDPAIVLSAKFYGARSYEKMRFSSDAITIYQSILQTEGENPFREASQLALVQLLNSTGRRSQALQMLGTLRQETGKPAIKAEASVRIGLILLDQKLFERAGEELQSALEMPEIGAWKEVAEVALLRLRYTEEKYKEAVALFESSSKEFSAGVEPEVWLIVANSYRQLEEFGKARELYDKILEQAPNTPHARDAEYERLVALYGADDKELLLEIDSYLDRHPDEHERRDQLTLMKAESFYKTKRYGIAAQLYESLEGSQLPPAMKAEALFKQAWSYAQVGEHASAIEGFSGFLAGNKRHKLAVTALAQRAFCYEQIKNYSAALNDFNALLEQYPYAKEREFALQRKALILGQQDESRAMVEAFNQLVKEYPKSKAVGQAYYWIGLTAFQAKSYKEALAPLKTAREKDKEFAERSTALLLASLRYLEDRDGLAEEVDKAPKGTKIVPEVFRWLAKEYLRAKQPEAAEKYLVRLSALPKEENVAPVDGDWLDLGLARLQLQKWKEAEEAIEEYLKRVTQPAARANGYLALGQAQLGGGVFEAASKSANSALELQLEGRLNALGRMLSGDIAIAQGKHEEGAKHFMAIALVFEDPVITPQALEKAHLAYEKAGDAAQAAKVLNTLRSRYPEYKVGMLKL